MPKPKKPPRSRKATSDASRDTPTELTDAQRTFEAALRKCLPKERKFVKYKLEGRNHTEAAILAGYAEKNADVQGSQLLGRLRIRDAIEAGYAAVGLDANSVRRGIEALVEFDPASIMSDAYELVVDHVERRATDVVEDVVRELEVTRSFLEDLRLEDADDDELKPVQRRVTQLRLRQLELQVLLDRDPDAVTYVPVERRVKVPYVDLDKARALGMTRFIKGVKLTKFGRQVDIVSHEDALERAGKVHGLFRDRMTLENPDGSAMVSTPATVIVLPGNGRDES